MSKRALIIGQDKDYCYILKEFLSLRDLYVTVVMDYKEGLDRLLYEKPDITVIESAGPEPAQTCADAIRESNDFEIIDFADGRAPGAGKKSVLLFEDKSRINSLLDYLKSAFSQPGPEQPPDTVDEGSLENTFYPSLLIDINMNKRSGVLSINSSTNLIVYFINGNPVFAEGGDIETAIGRILLNSGKIDKETYEKTVDVASRSKQKFGQILFEMGITSPHELNSFLEFQMQEKILKGFFYIKGRYVFRSGEEFADRIVLYQVDLSRVIYEGVKRYIDAAGLEESNPTIVINPKLRTEINDIGLKPKELRFVQLLKDRSTVREVLAGSRLEGPEALKLLYFLSLFGLITLSGISPDDLGRESIEKLIMENESEFAVSDTSEFHSDLESLFADLKERESERRTEAGLDAGGSENLGDDFNQAADEPGADDDSQAGDAVESGLGSGINAEYDEAETGPDGFESTGPAAIVGDSDEQGFYILENDREEEQAAADFGENTPENEPGPVAESFRDEPPARDELSFTSQLQKSGEFQFGNESYESGAETAENPPGRELESGIADLFQPYNDSEGEGDAGEEVGTPSAEENFTFMDGAGDSGLTDTSGNEAHERDIASEFSGRVAEFHAAMEQKDYYEVLGVSRDSTLDEIRDSYYQLVKHFHPDVNPNADHETRARAEEIFTRITTAYETLSQQDKRRQYDTHEELTVLKSQAKYIYEAEMTFKKGITLLIQRNYAEAEKYIREAVQMNPEEAAYLGAHGWTKFLAAEDKSSVLDEVKNSLEKAIKMNDKIPENQYYLGCIYKHTDDLRNAAKYFQKAIELDPDYIEAKREVRLLNTRRSSVVNEKKIEKNFWSSLFKK